MLFQIAAIKARRRAEAQQRFMSGWLRLQNEVNALIDSTTADNTDQAVSGSGTANMWVTMYGGRLTPAEISKQMNENRCW